LYLILDNLKEKEKRIGLSVKMSILSVQLLINGEKININSLSLQWCSFIKLHYKKSYF